jgi:hypothetical protein
VLGAIDPLVSRLGTAYRAVSEYAALPDSVMASEVLPVPREIVSVFLRAVVGGREPSVDDVRVLTAMGSRRLEMGVPLEPMLHVYRIAGREVFDAIVAAVEPGEQQALAELGRAWMDYIDRASSVAASGYLDASHERMRRLDAQRGALIHALLAAADASDVAAVAAEFSVAIAPEYVPLLVAATDVTTRIDRISAAAPQGTLSGFRGAHVLLLVPDRVADLSRVVEQAGTATIAHGAPAEPGTRLGGEVRRTDLLLAIGVARGSSGVIGPDDYLIEQLLQSDGRVAAALERLVLEPLRATDRGGLVESTLRTWFATGSVPETARRELVHANTVTYRLQRVAKRTGLDPRVPQQALVLQLALAAVDSSRPDL